MALIEYATDEITQWVLDQCNCTDECGGGGRLTDNHHPECVALTARRMLDTALAEQRERIAQAIETKHERAKAYHYRSALKVAAAIARKTP